MCKCFIYPKLTGRTIGTTSCFSATKVLLFFEICKYFLHFLSLFCIFVPFPLNALFSCRIFALDFEITPVNRLTDINPYY